MAQLSIQRSNSLRTILGKARMHLLLHRLRSPFNIPSTESAVEKEIRLDLIADLEGVSPLCTSLK